LGFPEPNVHLIRSITNPFPSVQNRNDGRNKDQSILGMMEGMKSRAEYLRSDERDEEQSILGMIE
jgi:hypothetical protein